MRAVLAYVDSGNADAGLVYLTDTLKLQSAVIAASAPEQSHAPIIYPAALVTNGKHSDEAADFLSFLKCAEACEVFARYRFLPLTDPTEVPEPCGKLTRQEWD